MAQCRGWPAESSQFVSSPLDLDTPLGRDTPRRSSFGAGHWPGDDCGCYLARQMDAHPSGPQPERNILSMRSQQIRNIIYKWVTTG